MKTHDKYQKFFGDHFENTSEIQTKPIITEREKPPSGYIQNKWKQLLEKIKFSNQFLKAMTGSLYISI